MWMWKHHIRQKDYEKNEKYLASIMGDSAITCDEIIKSFDGNAEAKSYGKINLSEKKATRKT